MTYKSYIKQDYKTENGQEAIHQKKDMLYNDLTPNIEVNPETYEVKVDGKLATVDPADKVSMSRLYNLF